MAAAQAALLHVTAFTKHPVLSGAAVAVLGSITPWIEAIAHHFDAATITTVEHNVPDCAHDRISTQHFDQFRDKASAGSYDAVVSYSSVEHAGLGRYGDPLDPSGDFRAMAAVHAALKPNGTLFWGAPVGQDGLMWNAMRIYGRRRLPRLLEGFEVVEWFGHEEAVLDTAPVSLRPSGLLRTQKMLRRGRAGLAVDQPARGGSEEGGEVRSIISQKWMKVMSTFWYESRTRHVAHAGRLFLSGLGG